MSEDKSAYRQIMKATSIFGGVQVFQIIIGVIRSKFIAVLLGPAGMGIAGLLNSTTTLIAGLTNFGLSTSAIKNIAAAKADGDEEKVGRVIGVFRRLVWATGLLGALTTLFLSNFLSKITFGNSNYAWAFSVLSITLLINQISAGQSLLLRAMRQIKLMAKSSMIGSALGLLTTIPLYYFYGTKGIVPAIVIAAFTSLFLTWYFASKIYFKKVNINITDIKIEGKEMLTMGFMISLSGIITQVFSYFVRIFISNYGSIDDVGLYNAGFTIINTYVGMIFTAMATDYYPKLCSIIHNLDETNKTINQQAEIAVLLLSPIIIIFIVFINLIVKLLYSDAFLPINLMIKFAAAGMLFKAVSWAIAHVFLAKNSSKVFFWNELITNIYMFLFNIGGYYFYGLKGLGFSFLLSYFVYLVQVFYVSKKKFKYKITFELNKILFVNLFLVSICLLANIYLSNKLFYILGIISLIISIIFNLYYLNYRLQLFKLIKEKIK